MNNEYSIKKSNIILLLLDFLFQEGFEKAFNLLEQESGISLFNYPKELSFMKNLIFEGQWDNVFEFLQPFKDILGQESYKACLFEIKKIIFIESVESKNTEVEELVSQLDELKNLCYNNEDFMEIVQFLQSDTNNEELESNLSKNTRMSCFNIIRNILLPIFPKSPDERKISEDSLINLFKDLDFKKLNLFKSKSNDNSEYNEKNTTLKLFDSQKIENISHKNPKANDNKIYMINDVIVPDTSRTQTNKLSESMKISNIQDYLKENFNLNSINVNQSEIISSKFRDKENNIESSQILKKTKTTDDYKPSPFNNENNKKLNELEKSHDGIYEDSNKIFFENQESKINEMDIDFNDRIVEEEDEDNTIKNRVNENTNLENTNVDNKFIEIDNIEEDFQKLDDLDKEELYSKSQYDLYQYNILDFFCKVRVKDTKPIRTGCFCPINGNYMAIGTNTSSIKIFDIRALTNKYERMNTYKYNSMSNINNNTITKNEVCQIRDIDKHHNGSIYCIDWSSSGKLIASCSNDQNVKCMLVPDLENDSDDGRLELTMTGHKGIVRSVSFHPNDDLILMSAGQKENHIKIWDPEEGKVKAIMEGHNNDVNCIKWSNDGRLCFSSGEDKTIIFWDVRSCKSTSIINCIQNEKLNDVAVFTKNVHVRLHYFSLILLLLRDMIMVWSL